ncbi:MAG: single-stranded DNA-binding protein [Candidatus Doudnabacteria bacterium]|nr:single-stranded DNA-binding protein [Candidatus Doudnabacteria bacterium]
MDVNKVIIVGRLTRDPEARVTPSGINVASVSVATNFFYKNQEGQKNEQVEYHNVVVWRRLAEIATQYLKKGRRVLIEGRLQTRSWEGNDGAKRQRTEIIADNLIMLDSAGAGGGAAARPAQETPEQETPEVVTAAPRDAETKNPSTSEEISVEDIPF